MPIYEYACENCGHRLEAIQKLSDEALTSCPNCSQPSLRKLVSAAGFRLKGSGWYATDFKGTKKPQPAAEPVDAQKKAEPKKTGASEGGGTTAAK